MHARIIMSFLAMLTLSASALSGGAQFIPLGDIDGGDFYSIARDISGDGSTVLGWSKANNNTSGQHRGFRWCDDVGLVPIPHLGPENVNSIPNGVSFDGSIIIGTADTSFRWTEADGTVSIGNCSALNISGDGSIVVGYCQTMNGNEAATWTQADGWTTFGALGPVIIDAFFFDSNHDGTVFSGQSFLESPNVEPIRWTKNTGMVALGDIPGGLHYGLGWAISADGTTIVGDAIGDVGQDAFRWTQQSGLINLELPESTVTDSSAQDVSGDGSIIVGYSDAHGAMIWDATHGMRSMQQVLDDIYGVELPDWTLHGIVGVSDDGRAFAGHGTNPDGNIEAWLVRLPPFCAAGDLDDNNRVDVFDLFALLSAWGPCGGPNCPADFTGPGGNGPDGIVDVFDLFALLSAWGACPIP